MTGLDSKRLLLVTVVLGLFIGICTIRSVNAAVSMPLSSTFDCAEQQQGDEAWVACNGLEKGGDQTLPTGQKCQITSAANYPGGGGGRGSRTWWKANNPDADSNCGEPAIHLNSNRPELWVRWYQRFQPGWVARAGIKNFYIGQYGTPQQPFNYPAIYFNTLPTGLRTVANGVHIVQQDSTYFAKEYGGGASTSDGRWACNEVHWKAETTPGGTDAQVDWWINNTLYLHSVTTTLGTTEGYSYGSIPSNGETTGNPSVLYIDIDDLAISTTGRIGCLGKTDLIAPSPPLNLKVQ